MEKYIPQKREPEKLEQKLSRVHLDVFTSLCLNSWKGSAFIANFLWLFLCDNTILDVISEFLVCLFSPSWKNRIRLQRSTNSEVGQQLFDT